MESASEEFLEAGVEPVLPPPTYVGDTARLAFLPAGEFLADLWRGGIMLGAFDQKPAGVGVAAFGEASLTAVVAAG